MDYLSLLLCLLLAWAAIHLLLSSVKKDIESNPSKIAPGPSQLPILGNLFSLGSKPHISMAELARTYGPLMTLQLGRLTTVVVSSPSIAKEVLQKNDVVFSNRTVADALSALNHHQNSVVLLPVANQWRNLRKICNCQVFSTARLDASQNLRRDKRKAGLAVDIGQAAFTTTLNLLSSTFFSVDLGDPSSEYAREFKETARCIMDEAGKPNFSDYFPLLRKIPKAFDNVCVHFRKLIDVFNTMIDQRLQGKRPAGSTQGNDVLDALLGLDHDNTQEIERSNIPYLLLDLFAAGTDTTLSTVERAMAELLHNPHKLKKAQAELREIIGKGNPLEEPDIARLPYLRAIIKETFRLHPPVPFLIPRKVDSDEKLLGFTVPKNAQVLVNVWAMGRDPDIWENPNSFEPERFLESEIDCKGRDFELILFGAGRRICPGLPLGTRMTHLMLGSLIHVFDWKLDGGTPPEKMDMEDKFGITLGRAQPLCAIPVCN